MPTRRYGLMVILLMLPLMAAGQDDKSGDEPPNVVAPPPPDELTKGEELEPSVNIVRRPWATFEEYSVNGQVYAVKVTPSVGPPYYLYDSDGDGSLESRHDLRRDVPQTQQWEILTW